MRLQLLVNIVAFAALAWAAPQGGEEEQLMVETLDVNLCPAPHGYFADPFQCDKYYECKDGVPTEMICPDGQGFLDGNPSRATCEYLFNVDCTLRPDLQPASPSPNCPRANGYFAHLDETICDEFYYCANNVDAKNVCPAGLHFSKSSGNCAWKAQAKRIGCDKKKDAMTTFGNTFECPVVDQHAAVSHPRYQNPEDCRNFFVCFNGVGPPRDSGCDLGLVFSESDKACVTPNRVPECSTYYNDYFELYFSTLFGAKADIEHVQQALILGLPVPDDARPPAFGAETPKPTFNKVRGPTRKRVTPGPPKITELGVEVLAAEDVPHRLSRPSSPSRGGARPSVAAALPSDEEAAAPKRRRRPGAVRRRRPVKAKTTTTTTTTTTTPAPTAAPADDYYGEEYYDYDANYYYDDNSTAPVEQVPSTTTTTTTTTTTPAPTTVAPEERRRLPPSISRRRPSRPSRRRVTEEAEGGN